VGVEGNEGPKCAMAEITLVGSSVEGSLRCRVADDISIGGTVFEATRYRDCGDPQGMDGGGYCMAGNIVASA
jgi:hypothetical protein